MELISLREIKENYAAYSVDEDKDGKQDFTVFVDRETQKDKYLYFQNVEMEFNEETKGNVNMLSIDVSGNGDYNLVLIDSDLNGKFDILMIDFDSDGDPDIAGIDSEGKGIITQAWILKR